jgi:uncharacterized membrane protein YhaH (DUF805 family)
MGFVEAVQAALSKYAVFSGRSRRSEYWYFTLFNYLMYAVAYIVALFIPAVGGILILIIALAMIIPAIAVGVRRFHDIDRSGWWWLIAFVPLVGGFLLIVWFCTPGTPGDNRFGPNPIG